MLSLLLSKKYDYRPLPLFITLPNSESTISMPAPHVFQLPSPGVSTSVSVHPPIQEAEEQFHIDMDEEEQAYISFLVR